MSKSVEVLRKLSNAFGPPSQEEEVREILRSELETYANEIRTDKLGNIFFYHYGKEKYPTVMITAHMDEVSFLLTFIGENGFLRFRTMGGIMSNLLLGQSVVFRGKKELIKGVVGTKPPHLMKPEEKNQVIPLEDLFIDIGTENLNEVTRKGLEIGATGVFDIKFEELGQGYLKGKAFDDRAGCTVLVEVFKSIKTTQYNLVAVGTVQEEVGIRGARTATWQVDPDYGLAVEGTFAADVPGSRPDLVSSKLKGGPVITLMDRTVITHPTILQTLINIAKKEHIAYQFKKVPTGGTDAGAIHLTKAGVPSGTVAVPCRYIHAPAAITHIDDIQNTILLVKNFIRGISTKKN